MSSSETIIPSWVWKRKWSRSWARNGTIAFGLFVSALGLIILIADFQVRLGLENTCTSYTGCLGPNVAGTPLHDAWLLTSFVILSLAEALTVGGFLLAFSTWRMKEWEWAAMFGLQPFAKRLEVLYAQGKITKQQAEDIMKSLAS